MAHMRQALLLPRKGTTLLSVIGHDVIAIDGQFVIHRHRQGAAQPFLDGLTRRHGLAVQRVGQFRADQQSQTYRRIGIAFRQQPVQAGQGG